MITRYRSFKFKRDGGLLQILIAGLFVTFITLAGTWSACATIHGNWCGIGHRLGSDGTAFPPIDFLDAACMHHDLCITLHGIGNCMCDRLFLQELRMVPYQETHQAIKARALYDIMSWVPCLGPDAMGKPLLFFEQLGNDLIEREMLPTETVSRLFYTIGPQW